VFAFFLFFSGTESASIARAGRAARGGAWLLGIVYSFFFPFFFLFFSIDLPAQARFTFFTIFFCVDMCIFRR
jgi:hypothetical protein